MNHPNFEHIFGPVYLVRTSAGHRQAIKHYLKGEKPDATSGYPTTFPSVVSLENRYMGGTEVLITTCEHVNLVRAKLEKH